MKKFSVILSALLLLPLAAAELEVAIRSLGGNVRGFGVLAKYGSGGPRKVILTRTAGGREIDKKPDYAGFPQIASLKVFDPDGREVVFTDLGKQKSKTQRYEVTIPEGKAGVWRFSVANGLTLDKYTISFPDTKVWGVRGEMALTPGKKFPKKLYMYVPENAKLLMIESFGRRDWLKIMRNGKPAGKFKSAKRRSLLTLKAVPGEIIEADFSRRDGKNALAVDGAPGLWCVTPAAARELAGGCVKAGLFNVAGPYQARLRNKMLSYSAKELEVKLAPRTALPEKIEFPRREALLFGKYGAIESAESAAKAQILDKKSPFYGAMEMPADRGKKGDWTQFLNYKSCGLTFVPSSIGSLVTLPAKLNRAYKNPALVRRACLGAFATLSMRLSGDDIVRENDFRVNSYPHIHIFFAYDSLAKGGYYLSDLLSPDELALWKEGVLRVGDKAASCMGFESNQWAHMMTGHLFAYLFTKEKRFLKYFEVMMTCYLDCTFGVNSKYGQHPAGYFLEEGGPDGNYDHLNMYSLVEALWHYRKLDCADAKLVSKMQKAIARNLEFKQYVWLPSPDGIPGFPNAFNCRTSGSLSSPSYPGDYLASFINPLGYTRWMMIKMPAEGVGRANNFAHNATTDEWAERLVRAAYSRPAGNRPVFSGAWARFIAEVLTEGVVEKIVPLPYESEFELRKLPGFAVWHQAGIYGASFYDVAGSTRKLAGITSGGPIVLWKRSMGCVLGSMRGNIPRGKNVVAKSPDQVTWSAVYGTDENGVFCHSGKEHNRLSGDAENFSISGDLASDAGTLVWSYSPKADRLELTVKLENSRLSNTVLSLPFVEAEGRTFKLEDGKLTITDKGKHSFTVSFNGKASLSNTLKCGSPYKVRALRIVFDAPVKLVFK